MHTGRLIDRLALRRESKLICDFISPSATRNYNREIENTLNKGINWDLFYRIGYCQGVLELIYANTSGPYSTFIPDDILERLKKKYYISIYRSNLFLNEFVRVAKEFTSNGIRFILFKGIIFNNLIYPAGVTHDMQDLDIMIQKEQFLKVRSVLTKLGYRMARGMDKLGVKDNFMEFIKYDRFKKFNFIIDIQWGSQASFRDANKNGLAGLWERVRGIELNNLKVNCLSPEDMLFNLFFHQRRFGMSFSLRPILDIAYIIERYHKEIDWDFVLKHARLNKITSLTFFCLSMAIELFRSPCPNTVLKKIRPSFLRQELFYNFFANGLNYAGPGVGKEMTNPHFVFLSALLYDRIIDLFVYANSFSLRQFVRFCGLKHYGLTSKILFNIKFLSLPIYVFFKWIYVKLKNLTSSRPMVY